MSDLPPESDALLDSASASDREGRLLGHKTGWRGRIATALLGVAGGMAVNDFSATLGYRGLAGVLAVGGVVAAAAWLRGLDARAWLPRNVPPAAV
jgi:hypothetical protein